MDLALNNQQRSISHKPKFEKIKRLKSDSL